MVDRTRGAALPRLAGLCVVAGLVLAGLLFPVAGGLGVVSNRAADAVRPISAQLLAGPAPGVTTVTAVDGTPIATLFEQYRIPISWQEIPRTMQAAIVSIEDRGFFTEGALDPRAMLRAALHNAGGGSTQGASTITQQYVKNYLINVADADDPAAQQRDRSDTLARKVREAELAAAVSRQESKEQILTGYLNVVSFGNETYGLGAAARYYFGRPPETLTVAQSALLAGLVNNPSRFNPHESPGEALARRDTVIDAMVATKTLDPAQAAAAKAEPLGVKPPPPTPPDSCYAATPDAGFFCDYAVSYLERAGLTEHQIFSGGYTITTTLDPAVSRIAKQAVDQRVGGSRGVANPFVIIKPGPSSHDVVAMVSNRTFGTDAAAGQTGFNQPGDVSVPFGAGSIYKMFTTAAALQRGTARLDTPLPNPGAQCFPPPAGPGPCATIRNDGAYPDPIALRQALASSPNVAFTNLELRTGMDQVLSMATRLGMRETMSSNMHGGRPGPAPAGADNPATYTLPQDAFNRGNLAFTLGFTPFSPLELTNAGATLADHGRWCPPNPIKRVADAAGRPVPIAAPPCEQTVPPGLANTLMQGLGDDIKPGGTSAAAAQNAGWTRPTAAKTGTTQDNESVAFLAMTDGYAASSVIYADGPDPGTICATSPPTIGTGCSGAFGGTVAAPTFFTAFTRILAGRPDTPLPPADPAYARTR
ncbi:MAG TPA: transglycosylase domain-containing protein [Amycolatopsis sp.]|nr:transglycosylase domain-containing protein [Amycolatopsis sp.]